MRERVRRKYRKLKEKYWTQWRWKRSLWRNNLPLDFKVGGWSMQEDDFLCVENHLEHAVKGFDHGLLAVELGSGVSTVFFAKLFARLGKPVSFSSFEAEPEWFDKTNELLKHHKCQDCRLQFVPYRDYGEFLWFDMDLIQRALPYRPVDILIIDAPPGNSAPFARRPAMDFFWPYMDINSVAFLHDTKREEEAKIVQDWSRKFWRVANYGTDLGLTAFWTPDLANPFVSKTPDRGKKGF